VRGRPHGRERPASPDQAAPALARRAPAGAPAASAAFSGASTGHGERSRGAGTHHRAKPHSRRIEVAKPANTAFAGITTFRGNASRSYYGEGPVPRSAPRVLWRYPRRGGMCMRSADEHGVLTWCGVGWTGQANVIEGGDSTELRFGAYDGRYHFLDADTGEPVRADLPTGDLAKGSATSDPDGYPLYYAGSRDNKLRIVALDRDRPTVLWELDAVTSVPRPLWNNDWDGAPLVIQGHLLVGGENSWFYVIRLDRGYGPDGKVRVRPRVVARVPGFDAQLLRQLGDERVSIESSVAFRNGVAYFANSGGLVQGWDVSRVLRGGSGVRRVFRFWTGDDTDASVVIDREGFLYVASEYERHDTRSDRVGQLMKLDPRRPRTPLVWSLELKRRGFEGKGGIWATPAIYGGMLYVATNAGELVGVDRKAGTRLWSLRLRGPTWSSPVVVDDVLLQGDCSGRLRAYDVSRPSERPRRLWAVDLGRCIEATPSVFRGRIYVGTRGGAMFALGDAAS
jgi:outer membrane protein assembly factor BamB